MLENEFYKLMLESLYEGIYFVDLDRKINFWNKGAELITGFKADEVIGKCCKDNILNHVDDFGNHLCLTGCPLEDTMIDGTLHERNLYLHHKDGHRVKIAIRATPLYEGEKIIGAVEVFRETAETNLMFKSTNDYSKEELKLLALYDQLTKLPNRRNIESFIQTKFNEFNSANLSFGIAFMDIDDFRLFNNNFGHELGDKVLQTVAKTYNSVTRNSDIIGRWGGEEFLAVFSNVNEEQLSNICERIRMLVENSVLREDSGEYNITISVGGALVKAGDTLESLVKRADENMYISKQNGKNQVTIG